MKLWSTWVAIGVVVLAGCGGSAESVAEPSADPPVSDDDNAALRQVGIDLSRMNDPEVQNVPAFRVFDDLSYVGMEWVSCWVVETSEGLVLIDSLYGDFIEHAVAGIRSVGLDPADLKYVLVTHGHFDHNGGAAYFQREFGAQVAMTAADWTMSESGSTGNFAYDVPNQDLVIADGDTLQVGDKEFRFFVTPGHTEGVLSMEFTVNDGGTSHRAFTFGGVGLNFEGVDRTLQYLSSVGRLEAMEGIEVSITNHASMGGIFERAERLASRHAGDPHPFVDPEAFQAWLPELRANAEAKLEQEREKESGDD
ncbi:MAG: MBL fold metallo-hydrolase [Acidobacteriota bacterium]|nr:MBL fold metallo-hydrolase [Acidobacteriota bacterium]